ncbi:MAG: tRNA pseudouridine(38-40) synthase TruA [Salinivirgaceae bacterium]|nr:tRNA pseudouridine(38-40) synthase TruA [Salinivirgaceae bacterium]
MRYFLVLDYNGANYCGWQRQPEQDTVQERIEKALSTLLRHETEITGAGRTDTGVHARNYVAHFDSDVETLHTDADFLYKLNCILPFDINIQRIAQMHPEAHARFDATRRTYKYYITTRKDVFRYPLTHRAKNLDIEKMNAAAAKLLEYTDFTSFSKLNTDVKTNNCTIFEAQWAESEGELVFTITANRFLRNMVRAIVGTLIEVGYGKLTSADFCRIIESKDRSQAGTSAPAQALFLERIEYPYEV